ISTFAVDPNDSQQVFVSIGQADGSNLVYFSKDAGKNWDGGAATGNLPKSVAVNKLIVDIDNKKQVLYAATNMSVYRGVFDPTGGKDKKGAWIWELAGDKGTLPNVQVSDLQLRDIGGTKLLTAATYGRGVWQIQPRRVVASAGAIGDYAWLDKNRDGLQGYDEIGVGGIGVDLYRNGGPVPEYMASTWTFPDGYYE